MPINQENKEGLYKNTEKDKMNKVTKNRKYNNFKQIINSIYNEELAEIDSNINDIDIPDIGSVKLQPNLIYDKFSKKIKVEFKIGNKRMYKIKNLSQFYKNMINNEFYKYGDKLKFVHKEEMFEEESQKLLKFIIKYAEIIYYINSNANTNYQYYGRAMNDSCIILSNTGLDEFFEIEKGKDIEFKNEYTNSMITLVDKNPNLDFCLKKVNNSEYKIEANFDIYSITVLRGKEYKYILQENKLFRCNLEFEQTNLKLLDLFKENYVSEIVFSKDELGDLFSILLPKVKNAIKIDDQTFDEIKKLRPEKFHVKVFLDFDKKDYLVADVRMCYGDKDFNPLNEKEEKSFKNTRNIIEETQALNIFRKTGFMFDTKNIRFILPDDDKIYEFLTKDISIYMKKFEVLVTENFKTKEITKPKIGNLGVKLENNLLEIDLSEINIDTKELRQVIEKYNLKKKYYRLKDGSFLKLEDNEDVNFLNELVSGMDIDYKELENGSIKLPVNRSLYLNELLKKLDGTEIKKDIEYRGLVNKLDKRLLNSDVEFPENMNVKLRTYQKVGFEWLKTLDLYGFGGILADDMGLGKTIQIITILESAKENGENRTSIVISPSSLAFNWKNEVEKFAPNLKACVIRGNLEERRKKINELEKYDLVITSYDLLKRDIEIYENKNYTFRFIIADEAQYLKNNNTQNAKSIKQINAITRFALTGTPIENSLAELWSIFDFIMPGYLFSYKKFKDMYETPIVKGDDKQVMEQLKMLIEPFVLRRTKKQVLTELPEKVVTVLYNEMEEEQKKIYLSYLLQARQELQQEFEDKGFGKSQIKILAALTRLRQICCHPGLFIQDYNEDSSKLEQCMEIIEDGVSAGHKILLFSSYTSMFPMIEKRLEEKNIKYFKLIGSTKVDERIDLVDEFNQNENIKVFLISLKAGGTGLNLIGADMVIHYDPWWNLSAENQATDRAYRIGQKNNVQVYKLITKDSIEEKIYEIQQRKADLTDRVLDTQTTFINKLSKDDIMKLFS